MNKAPNIMESKKKEETIMNWSNEEKKSLPPQYGCEILVYDGSVEDVKSTQYPSDAYIVFYEVDGKKHLDLCRGKKVNIFDLYYDKFGAGVIKKIDFGYGRINPRVWGYQPTEKKKRR